MGTEAPEAPEILKWPNEALTSYCYPLRVVDEEAQLTAAAMATAVAVNASAVGLAANQIGVLKRIIIVRVQNRITALFNPVIRQESKKRKAWSEACLSLPGLSVAVSRPLWLNFEALDMFGKRTSGRLTGQEACIFCHELDHLNGRTILDSCIPDHRERARAFADELERTAADVAEGAESS